MHFWGPKPLQCLPCLLDSKDSRGMWECRKVPVECSTDGLKALGARIGAWCAWQSCPPTPCLRRGHARGDGEAAARVVHVGQTAEHQHGQHAGCAQQQQQVALHIVVTNVLFVCFMVDVRIRQ